MTIALGKWHYRPALVTTLATLLLLALLLYLGFWQLDRARQKDALLTAEGWNQPIVALDRIADPTDPGARFRRVEVRGRYQPERQLLLDNQIVGGRPGYHVYTPLRLADDGELGAAVLVNRGWIAAPASRRMTPQIDLDPGHDRDGGGAEVRLRGRLSQPANPGLKLGSLDVAALRDVDWPLRLQHIDYAALSAALGYPLLPAVLLLDADQTDGYRRDWRLDFGTMTPAKHRGYAAQWFGLAATLLIIYLLTNITRRPLR